MSKKIIILIRHGIAEGKLGPKPDYDRELVEEGRLGVYKNAQAYKKYFAQVQRVYCSGSTRTRQTLDIIQPYLTTQGYDIVLNDHIYDKEVPWEDVLDLIRSTDERYDCIALIAHSPSISDVYSYLSPQDAYHIERGDIVVLSSEKKRKDL